MTYTEHSTTGELVDEFQFKIFDGDGAQTQGGPANVFTFHMAINFVNRPPVVANSSISVGLGAAYSGTITASDPDLIYDTMAFSSSPQTLTYSIVNPLPTKGNVTSFDANTGAFTYTATLGQTGADTINFQVSDQITNTPGTISVTIENQAPSAANGSVNTAEYAAVTGNSFQPLILTCHPKL